MGEVALRDYLGGSDVSAALGLSPWKTPVALYMEKRAALAGEAPAESDSLVKRRGKRWESVALEMLVESLSDIGVIAEVEGTNERAVDWALPWARAEIDADLSIRLPGHGLTRWNAELKTVSPFNVKEWGDPETDQIPTHYAAQVQWGLMVTGRQTCVVGALFGADLMKPYIVERDEEVIAWLREGAIDFWVNHVLAGVPPKPLALADVALLYPTARDTIVQADDALTGRLMRYRALHAEIKAREAERDALEFEIAQAMGDASLLTLGDTPKPVFTYRNEEGPFLDQQRLKNEFPAAHKACMTKWQKRVLRYKPFDPKGVM